MEKRVSVSCGKIWLLFAMGGGMAVGRQETLAERCFVQRTDGRYLVHGVTAETAGSRQAAGDGSQCVQKGEKRLS